MLPWKFLELTQRDRVGELLRIWNQLKVVTAVTTVNAVAWQVPAEKIAAISAWSAFASTAGVANVARITFQVFAPDQPAPAVTSQSIANWVSPAGSQNVGVTVPGMILVPPRSNIFINAEYSAAAAGNLLEGAIQAVLIPRGDFAVV